MRGGAMQMGKLKTRSRTTPGDPKSFHRAMSPVLVVAQCFALLPLEGITAPHAAALRFRWGTIRVIYSMLYLCGTCFLLIIFSIDFTRSPNNESYISRGTIVVYEFIIVMAITLFFRLATKWPEIVLAIQDVEMSMEFNYGYPNTIKRELRIIASIILTSTLVEHLLASFKSLQQSLECGPDWLQVYINHHFPVVFTDFMDFNPLVAIVLRCLSFANVVTWNSMDVLIVLLSHTLSSRLAQLNCRLTAALNKPMAQEFYREIHRDYRSLAAVIALVDQHIQAIVFLSFGNNVFFVCVQLFNATKRGLVPEDAIYFGVSFFHLVVRSVVACLIAAEVYQRACAPRAVLFSVPSHSYCQTVRLLLDHVTADPPALTGLGCFHVTRDLLLKLAGTIITYELVLIQLSSNTNTAEDNQERDNSTLVNPLCPGRTI